MKRISLLALAALSTACLLPTTGARAQDETAAVSDTVMDVGQFRDALHKVHDLFTQIRENHTLSLAAQDSMVASKYGDQNRRLMTDALGVLDSITRNWKSTDLPAPLGATAEARSNTSIERLGSANAQRYATESDDTAFVRTTVWEIQNRLNADKLNGRDPIVNDQIMKLLDAAMTRADSPSFRVAWKDLDQEVLSRRIEFSQTEQVIPPAPAPTTTEETTTTETTEVAEAPTPEPAPTTTEETTTERTEVAQAPPTEETTTIEETSDMGAERVGAADLPQTGGDPGMLVLLGSSLMGVGAFLRRRK